MDTKKKIVVIGSSNTDMVIKSDRLPKPGETILGGNFLMNHGGKGANQAVAAARLGGDVTFICKIGNDIFGNETLEMFHKEKIDTTYVGITPQEPSGVALINVDKKGENCIVVASGANGTLSIDDIQHAEPAIKQASIVIMQLETPIESVTYAAKMAKKDGITVILNPAPAPTQQLPDELLANVDILIPNVTEAEIISGMHITDDESAKEAIRYISSKGIKTVIITMGAKGALAYENNEFIHIPAFKVEAVDTTAAGDTFCGGLCVALSEGKNLKDAIIFAMANPVPEIMPDVAKAAGAKVVGTGRSDFPNQVNNVIAFPGIFKGALEGRARQITEDMKLAAALAIANLVPDDEVSDVNILPEAFDPRVADVVSKAVIDHIEK